MDNGTMVEVFKYLNYCQLATNSLVSKRFRNVIKTHRHKLALLYVDDICMERLFYNSGPAAIKIFNNELSLEGYNEWFVRNNYAKQISSGHQAAGDRQDYELNAYGDYKDPSKEPTSVFFARAKELNHETWPLFQHFLRLLSDPFITIRAVKLTLQTDIFNLLATSIDCSNHGRLHCEILELDFMSNTLSFFNWIKNHVRCASLQIAGFRSSPNYDKQLLDFFATGSRCTSEIFVIFDDISKDVFIDLVQKFVDLKNSDENHIVHSIEGTVTKPTAETLKSNYAKFFVNEEKNQFGLTTTHVFGFVNADIEKKLQLTIKNFGPIHQVKLEITKL